MSFGKFDDPKLWKLIAKGNQEAFAQVYNVYAKDLFTYGHKFTLDADLIEDVIQDVFVHIWESRNSLTIQKSIKFYLFSSFRRELIKRINGSHKRDRKST